LIVRAALRWRLAKKSYQALLNTDLTIDRRNEMKGATRIHLECHESELALIDAIDKKEG